MEIFKPKFTLLQQTILRFLAINTQKSFNALELSKELKVSPTAIIKSLHALEQEALIKIKKDKRFSITFNGDSKKAREFKRVENLRNAYESGLLESLSDEFPGTTMILFGSYSQGYDSEDSDIDIAIIGKERKVEIGKFERILHRKITLQFYPNIKDIQKNLRENILNGIVVKGGIQL